MFLSNAFIYVFSCLDLNIKTLILFCNFFSERNSKGLVFNAQSSLVIQDGSLHINKVGSIVFL